MLRLAIILASFTLGFAVKHAEAGDCSTATLELPDLNVLKLADGDQVVATVMTERGKLEFHVHVAKGVASNPTFVLAGKPHGRDSGVQAPERVSRLLAPRALGRSRQS